MRNVPVRKRVPFEQLEVFSSELQRVRSQLGEVGRVLVRYSGTEAKARILVETDDQVGAEKMADSLRDTLLGEFESHPH
jgi:phosphoglucosamine mutase